MLLPGRTRWSPAETAEARDRKVSGTDSYSPTPCLRDVRYCPTPSLRDVRYPGTDLRYHPLLSYENFGTDRRLHPLLSYGLAMRCPVLTARWSYHPTTGTDVGFAGPGENVQRLGIFEPQFQRVARKSDPGCEVRSAARGGSRDRV
eukprot:2066262-Rhodomonas_salina.1